MSIINHNAPEEIQIADLPAVDQNPIFDYPELEPLVDFWHLVGD